MTNNIVTQTDGEMVVQDASPKILQLGRNTHGIDWSSALTRILQCLDTAHIATSIEKTVEYVVQVPTEFKAGLASGEYAVMESAKTGKQWATLVRTLADGKKEIVCNLPIKEQALVQGNPMHDISMNMQMMALQQQIANLTEKLQEVCDTVKRIEQGQTDDRIGLLLAGREGIEQAMLVQDTTLQKVKLASAQQTLLEARGQIAATLRTKVNEFPIVPKSSIGRLGLELKKSGSLARRDELFDSIQLYYQLYLTATRLLAESYLYCGEQAAAQKAYADGISFLNGLSFDRVKTLRYMHPEDDFSDSICEQAAAYMETERNLSLEAAKPYDAIEMVVTGELVMNAIGGTVSETV